MVGMGQVFAVRATWGFESNHLQEQEPESRQMLWKTGQWFLEKEAQRGLARWSSG